MDVPTIVVVMVVVGILPTTSNNNCELMGFFDAIYRCFMDAFGFVMEIYPQFSSKSTVDRFSEPTAPVVRPSRPLNLWTCPRKKPY